MATNNFYNHKNGIFVINLHDSEDDYKEYLKMELEEELLTQEEYDNRLDSLEFYNAWAYDEADMSLEFQLENIKMELEDKGYDIYTDNEYEFGVYRKGKAVAWCTVEPGYYDGVQLIVDTDPEPLEMYYSTLAELYEMYTPHHKRLLKLIEKLTTPIVKVGQFNNGEALYEYKNN